MPKPPLSPVTLARRGLGADVQFETTEELEDLDVPLGQARAADALRVAVALQADGYNAFVMGPPGAGKHALVSRMLERAAADAATPSDWCYLNDFQDPRRPRALELPAGRGPELKRDLDQLVAELRVAIPAAFESGDHRTRLQLLEKELEDARERVIEEVRAVAEARGVALLRTPLGFAFAPTRDGEVLDPERFHALPPEEQERYRHDVSELQERLQNALRGMPDLERRHRERVKEVNREAALYAAGHLLDDLRRRWADLPAVLAHLDAVQQDVVDNVHELLGGGEGDGDVPAEMRKLLADNPALRKYRVNVLAEHSGHRGAPVVREDLPTLANLSGRIEHHAHFGTLVTDFNLIRSGALHRANGGFLVLEARRVLAQPFAWEELKRALRSGVIRIEPPERLLGLVTTSTLDPEPIPLSVKVVLLGDRVVWQLLSVLDPDFPHLFKVVADLEDDFPRTPEAEVGFARLVATLARREGTRPLERGAVDRLLHEATRLAGDATRLSADAAALRDVVREADLSAASEGRNRVLARDVVAAVAAQERRGGRIRDRIQEEIQRGTLVIETTGARVGQVNGLAVVPSLQRPFGRPSRISARVRLGRGEVVDIEREVELGGPIHSKGVLILSGFLGARYCQDSPLTMAATIVFEQSYSGVEGDSASCAELCALLSAIAGVPLRQALAITGSVDQLGRVQAVGGVTEKVEGFFEVCRARGLTGEQGVLLPATNVAHLALHDDVLAAIAEERFRIWGIETVDEAVELLSGTPAGAADAAGRFPEGTFNARVAARLAALAEKARAFAAASREEGAHG